MYRLTDYGAMLRDHARVDAYRRALAACITPTSVVLDLGTGLGTFSVLACNLGAATVYAVDSADAIFVAEEIARVNGVSEQMQFIRARAADVELPEQVDVLVSDLAGALPLFEEHIPALIHAREHLLKPDGVMIPRRARLFCAPISSTELHTQIVEPWRSVAGVDLSPAETMAMNTPHALKVEPQHLAGEPLCWAELDYATIDSPNVSGTVEWQMTALQPVHGVALWFESVLHDGITHSSGPWSPGSVHATMVLPLLAPLELPAGEKLRFTIESALAGGRYVVTWQANDGARQSTFLAEPRSNASFGEREEVPAKAIVSGDATFQVAERVLSRRVGDEVLLFHLSSGVYHVLNQTAARVWTLLENGGGVARIIETVASEYDVDPQSAAKDVNTLVARLQEQHLITPT
ncbi:MAG TPA: HPr-rel-A system PqqD family peptide chaperone [Thermoanaerobaculia bacterium]|nr:HPr-rel-A system PqqD family peptide chaperone [Thermoanaerobaculia bacterium]